ncbi:hypothetical protein BJ742DRAFT_788430 [Cladochytrium replicatum]|nr:hypothetical protein BJ742DRAFT_788430 [Cladochytrium replicatum]
MNWTSGQRKSLIKDQKMKVSGSVTRWWNTPLASTDSDPSIIKQREHFNRAKIKQRRLSLEDLGSRNRQPGEPGSHMSKLNALLASRSSSVLRTSSENEFKRLAHLRGSSPPATFGRERGSPGSKVDKFRRAQMAVGAVVAGRKGRHSDHDEVDDELAAKENSK